MRISGDLPAEGQNIKDDDQYNVAAKFNNEWCKYIGVIYDVAMLTYPVVFLIGI